MKGVLNYLVIASTLMALACSVASAFDPAPLQDFCVAVNTSTDAVFVNGKFCKDPKLANANDFFFQGLNIPRSTANRSTRVERHAFECGQNNTLSVSLARIDFAPYGLNPPHIHPHATEIFTVIKGTLYVGFVTSNPDNRLFTTALNAGDVFVFPISLINFQFNVGNTDALAFSSLSSQNPERITIADTVFGSNPLINPDVLTKALQLNKNVVNYLQKQFSSKST
ncbi:germin-like protein subfamily 1 member 7 [Alnus glutinosa]|uniref:germin-like protein subfamily 1 member 7 n=1 Tax=Alnus glutinosa TaxID=3517 RepID=UPI002D7841D0|nr:germin-like protein subfamily 1 member 7 [Alnus glutinosa]